MTDSIRFTDVLYFLAELAVYVAVTWWGFTRDVPAVARWGLGLGGLVVFAVVWGLFAAPRAPVRMHGGAGLTFRIVWFGLGAAAVVAIFT